MITSFVHLAPRAPWGPLVVASAAFIVLALWAYRFAVPPLPKWSRGALPLLRMASLLALAWLLAQPVLERSRGRQATRVAVLVDRSWSMDLPAGPGERRTRAQIADAAVHDLLSALRGRAVVREMPFAGRLGADSSWRQTRGATALGSVLAALSRSSEGQDLDGVIVVSDGIVNAGEDPVSAARSLGVPVSAVLVGSAASRDRAVIEVEAPPATRVGERTPVRVRVKGEGGGDPVMVRLLEDGREIAHARLPAPAAGAEAVADLLVIPSRPGLAVWTATVDSVAGEITTANNAKQVALEVAPGRLGVLVLSAELNWDLTFLRRSLSGDSSLALDTRVRERGTWRSLEAGRVNPPSAADLRGRSVVVLDGLGPAEMGAEFDRALASFTRTGGGLLLLAGAPPGIRRFAGGQMGADLALGDPGPVRSATPAPTPEARDILAWDDDPARGDRAWRAAAPLAEVSPLRAGAGDRVMLAAADGGSPLMIARRIGRGQAVWVNGTGLWRWSLTGLDELSGDRGKRLWRRLVRWLAAPVQGEPLRVRPERWLTARGEAVRLLASLQDSEFRPVGGATIDGQIEDSAGRRFAARFGAREAGSYVVSIPDLGPGRYRLSAHATQAGRDLGSASSEFAVDRWSLEESRTEPDSSTLAAVAAASGGRVANAVGDVRGIRSLPVRVLARSRTESIRLWESPWVFALVVGALSIEWAWRRRRGLP